MDRSKSERTRPKRDGCCHGDKFGVKALGYVVECRTISKFCLSLLENFTWRYRAMSDITDWSILRLRCPRVAAGGSEGENDPASVMTVPPRDREGFVLLFRLSTTSTATK